MKNKLSAKTTNSVTFTLYKTSHCVFCQLSTWIILLLQNINKLFAILAIIYQVYTLYIKEQSIKDFIT